MRNEVHDIAHKGQAFVSVEQLADLQAAQLSQAEKQNEELSSQINDYKTQVSSLQNNYINLQISDNSLQAFQNTVRNAFDGDDVTNYMINVHIGIDYTDNIRLS